LRSLNGPEFEHGRGGADALVDFRLLACEFEVASDIAIDRYVRG
jgi:hypothetical protein